MKDKHLRPWLSVITGGESLVSHSGGTLLVETARRSGLAKELSSRLGPWRLPFAVHDPGKIVLDVAVAVALGGDAACDVALLRRAVCTSSVPPACDTNDSPPVITDNHGLRCLSFTCEVPLNSVRSGSVQLRSNRAEQAPSRIWARHVPHKINYGESPRLTEPPRPPTAQAGADQVVTSDSPVIFGPARTVTPRCRWADVPAGGADPSGGRSSTP